MTDGTTGDTGEPVECRAIEPGSSPVRRMTRREYDNTVHDLLGDDSRPAKDFPAEEEALGFNNNADALVVTSLLAESYLKAAETLAATATADLPKLLRCDPGKDGEDACARGWITDFGKRAYRRPLAKDEVDTLFAIYSAADKEFDFETGIRLTLTAMLQSPHFLYRVEFGVPMDGETALVKVGPYELASRLSYFLWGTMPDDKLFAAADGGKLETKEDVLKQAQRMLGDPRARASVRDFHGQWLQFAHLDEVEKDPEVFPEFDESVRPLLRAEADALVDHVVWEGEGDLDTLLMAPYTFLNAELADYYGIKGPKGESFTKFDLPEGQGSGLLTQGGLMSLLAKHNQTSPIHRGKFVRERLLCQLLPPPPDDVDITPPEVDPSLPTRERFKQHSVDPACSGCHNLMDPIGFGFEHFDAIGRWRDEEAGLPIDASGEILGVEDGKFDGIRELAALIADREDLSKCVTLQWFRYAYGRTEDEVDACTLNDLSAGFSGSGRKIQDLLLALTQTDVFMYRRPVAGEGGSP